MGGLGAEGHRHLASAGPGLDQLPAGDDRDPVEPPSAAPLEDPVRRRDLLDHGLHPQPRLGDPEAGRRADPMGLEPLEPKLAHEVIGEGGPVGQVAEELVDVLTRRVDQRLRPRSGPFGGILCPDFGINRPNCGRFGLQKGRDLESPVSINPNSKDGI